MRHPCQQLRASIFIYLPWDPLPAWHEGVVVPIYGEDLWKGKWCLFFAAVPGYRSLSGRGNGVACLRDLRSLWQTDLPPLWTVGDNAGRLAEATELFVGRLRSLWQTDLPP